MWSRTQSDTPCDHFLPKSFPRIWTLCLAPDFTLTSLTSSSCVCNVPRLWTILIYTVTFLGIVCHVPLLTSWPLFLKNWISWRLPPFLRLISSLLLLVSSCSMVSCASPSLAVSLLAPQRHCSVTAESVIWVLSCRWNPAKSIVSLVLGVINSSFALTLTWLSTVRMELLQNTCPSCVLKRTVRCFP